MSGQNKKKKMNLLLPPFLKERSKFKIPKDFLVATKFISHERPQFFFFFLWRRLRLTGVLSEVLRPRYGRVSRDTVRGDEWRRIHRQRRDKEKKGEPVVFPLFVCSRYRHLGKLGWLSKSSTPFISRISNSSGWIIDHFDLKFGSRGIKVWSRIRRYCVTTSQIP